MSQTQKDNAPPGDSTFTDVVGHPDDQRPAGHEGMRRAGEGVPPIRMLKISEVAEILAVTTARTYELVRQGKLPATRLGRQLRVDPRRLAEWIAAGGSTHQATKPSVSGPRASEEVRMP